MKIRALYKGYSSLLLWVICVIVLGMFQLISQASYSKQDDPDQANQRPGFVSSRSELAPQLSGVSYTTRPTVIVFDRMAMNSSLFHDLADQSLIASRANLELVTPSGTKPSISNGIGHIYTDTRAILASSFHFDTPTDGGYPIGYVIVDAKGYIRYRTLDPDYMHHGDEILIMLKDSK